MLVLVSLQLFSLMKLTQCVEAEVMVIMMPPKGQKLNS